MSRRRHKQQSESLERRKLINTIYHNILNREPDMEALRTFYYEQTDLYEIQLQLWNSEEFKNKIQSQKQPIDLSPLDNNLQIRIINLKRREDRKSFTDSQLKNLGILNYEFVEAVDGSQLDEETVNQWYDKNKALKIHREMPLSDIGASMSHVKIAEYMIQEKMAYILILEDDCHFTLNFKKFLASFDIKKDYKFDMLMLGAMSTNHINNGKIKKHQTYKTLLEHNSIIYLDNPAFQIGDFHICEPAYPSRSIDYLTGGHAYILSYEGAKKIVETNKPVCVAADLVWNINHDIKVFLLDKLAVFQTKLSEDSDIEHDRAKFSKIAIWKNIDHPDWGS